MMFQDEMIETMLSEQQFETLSLLCDTLAPSLAMDDDPDGFYARQASDLNVPAQMAEAIDTFTDATSQRELRLFLSLLENPLANGLLTGNARAFSEMDLTERTALLLSWSESVFPVRRKAFQSVKRLCLFLYYSVIDDAKHNPNWKTLHYGQIPTPDPQAEKPITPLDITSDQVLTTDVVIIGSGAGGGVIAGELTQAGRDVIVIEKGGYYNEADFDGYEQTAMQDMFENAGVIANRDLSIAILAGSTLGGGTTVNWCGSFHTPDYVVQEWIDEFGIQAFTGGVFRQSLDAVAQRINVNTQESAPNGPNRKLEQGAQALDYRVETIPRNVQGCEDCGFCNFGCQFGAKQSTLKTYLQDAYDGGARILVRTTVQRICVEAGRAVGVEAITQDADGNMHQVTVRANKVVVAAGAIHTPAILMRSGLSNAHIGANLGLHPTSVIYGLYDEEIVPWSGVMMSRVVKQFSNLDGQGYGVILETAPVHPGISAMSLSWQSGYQHKTVMAQLNNLANIIILVRDRHGGRITVDRHGNPQIHYRLSRYDARHLMTGIIEALKIQQAAGAKQVSAPYTLPYLYQEGQSPHPFEHYLDSVREKDLHPNNFVLYSAHQMSSCRMASSPRLGAVDPTGETYEVKNLYVADGSVLPTPSGVNPMLTIMGMAHYIAQGLCAD